MSCTDHPKYQAIRKPRSGCIECWRMFIGAEDRRAKEAFQKEMLTAGPCSCGHSWNEHGIYGCFVKVGSASCDDAYCSCGNTVA